VVKAYASAIQQGGALESLSRDMGIELIYLKELVQVTTDYDSNMLNISVTYPEEKGAKKILSKITDSIDAMYPEIQTNLGEHSVVIMNQNVGAITDQTLAEYQKQKFDDLAETNTKLKDTEKALDELKEPMKPVALSKMSIAKAGIKFGIVGWFAGAFISAGIVCAIFLLNGKIGADNDLKNRFGLKFLGGFSIRRKERIFSGIDDWLDSLEGKECISDESVYDMIAANIHNYNNLGQSVFVTGTIETDVLNDFVINLQRKMPDLVLGFGANMNRNVTTLQKVHEYDQIVLLEKKKQSKLRDIEKEVETVLNMNKVIMGYIILDSDKNR
jgi:capsular polysaccharide biosynthesis protein